MNRRLQRKQLRSSKNFMKLRGLVRKRLPHSRSHSRSNISLSRGSRREKESVCLDVRDRSISLLSLTRVLIVLLSLNLVLLVVFRRRPVRLVNSPGAIHQVDIELAQPNSDNGQYDLPTMPLDGEVEFEDAELGEKRRGEKRSVAEGQSEDDESILKDIATSWSV